MKAKNRQYIDPAARPAKAGTLAALCYLAVSAALLVGAADAGAQAARTKVKVGYNVVPIDAQMHLAREDKLMEKQGLDATWLKFESGGALVQAIATGDIDFAAAAEIPGIRPRLQGGKYVLVGQVATAPRFTGIYSKSAIKKPADLVGKKVGVTMGTTSELYLGLYAAKFGIPYEKITIVNVAPPEWIPALNRGDIDAFAGWEHFFSRADEILPKGTGHLLHSGNMDNIYQQPMYYYMSEAFAKTPAATQILKAVLASEAAVMKDKKRAAELSAKVGNIDVATSLKILNMIEYRLQFDQQSLANMRQAAGFLLSKKLINQEPDWRSFIDLAPLTATDPSRVKFRDIK
jgi:ABC-type nitrate/sulfonate/bicarbonate transport system substrate-binding protein